MATDNGPLAPEESNWISKQINSVDFYFHGPTEEQSAVALYQQQFRQMNKSGLKFLPSTFKSLMSYSSGLDIL